VNAWESLLQANQIAFAQRAENRYLLEHELEVIYVPMRGFQPAGPAQRATGLRIWEDQVIFLPEVIASNLAHRLHRSDRIHARDTQAVRLSTADASPFFEAFHLSGFRKAKYKYGLLHQDVCVAALTLAQPRIWQRDSGPYRSIELVQFAVQQRIHVPGGFRKLLQHAIRELEPDDIVTTVPLDWSEGEVYEQAGFQPEGDTGPLAFTVDWQTGERLFESARDQARQKRFVELSQTHPIWHTRGSRKFRNVLTSR